METANIACQCTVVPTAASSQHITTEGVWGKKLTLFCADACFNVSVSQCFLHKDIYEVKFFHCFLHVLWISMFLGFANVWITTVYIADVGTISRKPATSNSPSVPWLAFVSD
jgi:hypothetical protein